eukprot:767948-Hanusia_phi.AAC.12
MAAAKETVASAPGKVNGGRRAEEEEEVSRQNKCLNPKITRPCGYVVLERPNPAIVAAVSARVYAQVVDDKTEIPMNSVTVHSPQMDETRVYTLKIDGERISIAQNEGLKKNGYIEATILNTFAFIAEQTNVQSFNPISISINGDKSFYAFDAEDHQVPRFPKIARQADGAAEHAAEVQKTGLGSSAALVTSLVAALLQHFHVVELPDQSSESGNSGFQGQETLHKLAQYCHCIAQGKIGSGFDVAAAVFGSIEYVRFSPSVLDLKKDEENVINKGSLSQLISTSDGFDHNIVPWELPAGFFLAVGDVRGGGSSTPSMVSAINKWKISSDQAQNHWKKTIAMNAKVGNGPEVGKALSDVGTLSRNKPEIYRKAMTLYVNKRQGGQEASDVDCNECLEAIQRFVDDMAEVRVAMRQMGEMAGVPLEPAPQTKLLDMTTQIPHVLAAGVPGAGGFDAVFAIVAGEEGMTKVSEAWSSWSQQGSGQVRLMSLKCENQGTRVGGWTGERAGKMRKWWTVNEVEGRVLVGGERRNGEVKLREWAGKEIRGVQRSETRRGSAGFEEDENMQNSDSVPRRKKKGVTRSVRDVEENKETNVDKDPKTTPKKSSGDSSKNVTTPSSSKKQDTAKQDLSEGAQKVETPKKEKETEKKGKDATPVKAGDVNAAQPSKASNPKETNSTEKTTEKKDSKKPNSHAEENRESQDNKTTNSSGNSTLTQSQTLKQNQPSVAQHVPVTGTQNATSNQLGTNAPKVEPKNVPAPTKNVKDNTIPIPLQVEHIFSSSQG